MITVVVPVGPAPGHTRWLKECLDSIWAQSLQPSEVLLIDDMANLDLADNRLRVWRNPWLCGVAHSYNFGISLARNECVFMIASDDLLYPNCLRECWTTYLVNNRKDAYYYVGVEYMDDRKDKFQTVPCNTAMVTKGLWKLTGGFPIQTAHGANDAALLSIMFRHMSGLIIPVANGAPLAKMRIHSDQVTAKGAYWQGVIIDTRDYVTREWKEPQWSRYIP